MAILKFLIKYRNKKSIEKCMKNKLIEEILAYKFKLLLLNISLLSI